MPNDVTISYTLNGVRYTFGMLPILIGAAIILVAGIFLGFQILRRFVEDVRAIAYVTGHNPRKGAYTVALILIVVVVSITVLLYEPSWWYAGSNWVNENPIILIVFGIVAGTLLLWEGIKYAYRRWFARNRNT